MRKLIREISLRFIQDEGSLIRLNTYVTLKDHAGWKVHREILLMLQGKMAQEMLSPSFTRLEKEEKDARQRAYAYAYELTQFMLDPGEAISKALKAKDQPRAVKKMIKQRLGKEPLMGD